MPAQAAELLTAHHPLIIAGVTAAGKDTILKYIEESTDWRHVITHTTRLPREGELNGKNYWFVSEDDMLKLLLDKAMIEAKAVHGNTVYGTSLKAYKTVLDLGQRPMLRIDIQGIGELTNKLPRLQAAFILPPSFEIWMERLDKRGHMSHVEKVQRLRSAQIELREALKSRHFIFIVNNDIIATAKELLSGATDARSQHDNRELALRLIDNIAHF
jgi:guanylate kinase